MFERIRELLNVDPLVHINALKMLAQHESSIIALLEESPSGWGLAALIPTAASGWDRNAYPGTSFVVYLDSSGGALPVGLLSKLPVHQPFVLKTWNPEIVSQCRERFALEYQTSYVSFTCRGGGDTAERDVVSSPSGAEPELQKDGFVEMVKQPDDEVVELLARNGYRRDELEEHFAAGARAFVTRFGPAPVSTCFVYRNTGTVWEIGGLFTLESFRNRGLGRRTADAAIRYLAAEGRVVRYQVREDNLPSIRVASHLGLEPFLRTYHYLHTPSNA